MNSERRPRIVATVEARMGSSRLPGKVLLPANGKSILHHLVTRLRAVPSLDAIVLATTDNPADNVLADFADAERIACFRGSENDVMDRVIRAAEFAGATVIVEITGDCPIIDPQIVEQTIRLFRANNAVYASNAHLRSFPVGMDVQVFGLDSLKQSAAMTSDPLDREHVTLHMRNHPDLFPAVHLVAPPEMHWPELGLTLDEAADYVLIGRLIDHFGTGDPLFGCRDVIRFLREKPEWVAINRSVVRRGDA